jgi:hypothetical protein
MRYLLALLAFFSLPSYAGLWEYSLTGIAILPDGRKGIEVARYVWDTDKVTHCEDFSRFGNPHLPCPSVNFPFGGAEQVWQTPTTFSYFGLVNGTGTGVIEHSIDCCVTFLRLGGSTNIEHGVRGFLTNPIEMTFVNDTVFEVFPWSGGEDGWKWVSANGLPEERFIIESIRPLFVPEPSTLSLAALALFTGGIRRAKVSKLSRTLAA